MSMSFFTALIAFLLLYFLSCDNNPVDDGGGISLPPPIPIVAYNSPIWHPSGQFIGFNHIPIKSLHYVEGSKYPDRYELEPDSSGFWLINIDGTNMRRIFPTQMQTPAWSPDGQWIAFVAGAQIFKMRFTGDGFDTTTISQLTFEGRNFFPAWSHDGQRIAYNESICDGTNTCGIWLMTSDATNHQFLAEYGNYPEWLPSGSRILFRTRAITQQGQEFGDSLWIFNVNESRKSFLTFLGGTNSSYRFSPAGEKIAYSSQPLDRQVNLWLMDSTGNNLQQLTTEGTSDNSGLPFSWNPIENLIVFTQYRFDEWPPQNGTLWILNVSTGQKRQLTFNPQPVN